jgi:hypothetical protein
VFSFSVAANMPRIPASALAPEEFQGPASAPSRSTPAAKAASVPGPYVTVPSTFPQITVTVPASGTADGLVFVTNLRSGAPVQAPYLLALDNKGEPVYFQELPGDYVLDFKKLSDGTLSYYDAHRTAFVILDSSYQETNTIQPGNGYTALDGHDLQLLSDGHYAILVNEIRTVDMGKVVPGGNPQALVVGQIIQELDQAKNVVFQWRFLDHIPITETDQSLTASYIDYSHANAVEPDSDGNYLVSSRHLDEITKIDRSNGEILWRLGGKENEFTFLQGPGITDVPEFSHQHDIRRLSNGHITLFDNHNQQNPQTSRAVEYVLDENAKTATLVWEFRNNPDIISVAMGDAQRLPNGNTMIGWGSSLAPYLTEVRPDGTKAFELDLGGTDVTYRAFRFPWHATPTWPPSLVLQASNTMTLTFSWNGATDIASYRIYGSNTFPPTTLATEVPKTGFESSYVLQNPQQGYCIYRVMPIDTQGQLTQYSQVVRNPLASACTSLFYMPVVMKVY